MKSRGEKLNAKKVFGSIALMRVWVGLVPMCAAGALMLCSLKSDARESQMREPQPRALPAEYSSVALLGDSITDGLTYPLLLEQALAEAGYAKPVLINAGIGGDTAAGMSERLERDVLSRHPSMVFLSAGINDSRNVAPEEFRKSLVSMIEKLRAQKIGVTLLLPSMVRPPDFSEIDRAKLSPKELEELEKDEAETPVVLGRQAGYRIVMRQLATEYSLPVADIPGAMQKSFSQGVDLWEKDGTHLNFAGYRAFVRAVLDAMNSADVAVPETAKIEAAPGLIGQWQIVPLPDGTSALKQETDVQADGPNPLDRKSVEAMNAAHWKVLTLPQAKPQDGWYWEQARQYGMALDLDKIYDAKNFWVRSIFQLKRPQTIEVNTGAGVNSVWISINRGPYTRIWKHPGDALGWHASGRAVINLPACEYSLLAETGAQFFISVTPQ